MSLSQIEEVRVALMRVRQNPATKKKFPSEIWDAVIELTKTYSHKEICHRLLIDLGLLKRKIQQRTTSLEFHEVSLQNLPSETVVIELISKKGIRAKIQGPLSCLNCLESLLGE
ncbi:MAG: hypothetical protein KDK72_10510 [Chlamydiia bacterium]|nr:hypothetical protein [Chlamydiia bacterium]